MAALKLNLIQIPNRDYDPGTGRFVAKDPILFNGPGTNLYSYTLNDPVNYIDPQGTNPAIIGGAVIGGFVGAIGGYINAPNGCKGSGIFYGAIGGAIGGAVAGLTGGASTIGGTLGGIGFDAGSAAIGQYFGSSCNPPPPPPPPNGGPSCSGK